MNNKISCISLFPLISSSIVCRHYSDLPRVHFYFSLQNPLKLEFSSSPMRDSNCLPTSQAQGSIHLNTLPSNYIRMRGVQSTFILWWISVESATRTHWVCPRLVQLGRKTPYAHRICILYTYWEEGGHEWERMRTHSLKISELPIPGYQLPVLCKCCFLFITLLYCSIYCSVENIVKNKV